MEDVEFNKSHSNSPLPEAGNDPNDPLRPEIDEENSVPNPTNATTYQDMEVTEDKEEMPDQDDIEAGLSDNESALSEVLDDAEMDEQFGDFDASNIAIEERAIDEDTVKQIGVHKRKAMRRVGIWVRVAGRAEDPRRNARHEVPARMRRSRRILRLKSVCYARAPRTRQTLTEGQAESAHSSVKWMLSSRAAPLAAARRTESISSRWPTKKSRRCVAVWRRQQRQTTKDASAANQLDTS
jgi:hypothetical protein